MNFKCFYQWHDGQKECWDGRITSFTVHSVLYELMIQSRSGLSVLVGKYSGGNFACLPTYDAGCYLSYPDDLFYNAERLIDALKNPVDGSTVAYALKALSSKLSL